MTKSTFTEEDLNAKLHFLCSDQDIITMRLSIFCPRQLLCPIHIRVAFKQNSNLDTTYINTFSFAEVLKSHSSTLVLFSSIVMLATGL